MVRNGAGRFFVFPSACGHRQDGPRATNHASHPHTTAFSRQMRHAPRVPLMSADRRRREKRGQECSARRALGGGLTAADPANLGMAAVAVAVATRCNRPTSQTAHKHVSARRLCFLGLTSVRCWKTGSASTSTSMSMSPPSNVGTMTFWRLRGTRAPRTTTHTRAHTQTRVQGEKMREQTTMRMRMWVCVCEREKEKTRGGGGGGGGCRREHAPHWRRIH